MELGQQLSLDQHMQFFHFAWKKQLINQKYFVLTQNILPSVL